MLATITSRSAQQRAPPVASLLVSVFDGFTL